MPSKRSAKVVRLGKSLAIFLPADWVRGNEVEKGSVLEIVYDEVVTVKPPTPRADSE